SRARVYVPRYEGLSSGAQRHEPAREAPEQVQACEPGPLLVGLEQDVRLLGLDRPAPQRSRELHQPEVTREAEPVAAEPVEADDTDRPRPEPPLASEASCYRLRRQVA